MKPSPQARELIEQLHEPLGNEERWQIAEHWLDVMWTAGYAKGYTDCKDLLLPDSTEAHIPQADGG